MIEKIAIVRPFVFLPDRRLISGCLRRSAGELVIDLLYLPQAPNRGSDENGIVESTIPAECAALETSVLL